MEKHPLPSSCAVCVFFRHDVHIAKGVGCESCHGTMQDMPLSQKARTLTMGFCLDCHRSPARRLRPLSAEFDMGWRPPGDPHAQQTLAQHLMAAQRVHTVGLTDCATCHR